MTNLLNLPQIPAGTAIDIVSNCDWDDQFFVPVSGFPAAQTLIGTLASNESFAISSAAPVVPGAASVVPGMIASGSGIPPGTVVTSVTPTVIGLSNPATISAPGAMVTFSPPPLDLTGISFSSILRASAISPNVLISASTAVGTMTNGNTSGLFGWSVPGATMLAAPFLASLAGQGIVSCVVDVVATDATGALVNLCQGGPIAVNVRLSVTR